MSWEIRVQLSSLSQYMPQAYTYTTAVVLLLNFSRFVENPFVIIDLQVSLPVKNPLTLRLTFRMLNASLKVDVTVPNSFIWRAIRPLGAYQKTATIEPCQKHQRSIPYKMCAKLPFFLRMEYDAYMENGWVNMWRKNRDCITKDNGRAYKNENYC